MISISALETKGVNLRSAKSPWLFSNQVIHLQDSEINSQNVALVKIKGTNKIGIYNKNNLISVRFFADEINNYIENNFIQTHKLTKFLLNHLIALKNNKSYFPFSQTEAYRLSHGDNDFLPAIAIDFYQSVFVLQISSAAGEFLLPYITDALKEFTNLPIFERSTGQIRKLERLPERTRWIREPQNASQFSVPCSFANLNMTFSLNKAQKTGLFLDQRNNLKYLENIILPYKIESVLDICSYAGAWSASAARLGTKQLTLIDQDAWALNLAKENILANSKTPVHIDTLHGDMFEHLQKLHKDNKSFNLIIADPPAFAKAKKHIPEASRAYSRLAKLASKLLTANGVLVICSCSRHISDDIFLAAIAEGFDNGNWVLLHKGEQSPCHTRLANAESSEYLKCYFIQKRVL